MKIRIFGIRMGDRDVVQTGTNPDVDFDLSDRKWYIHGTTDFDVLRQNRA